MLPSIKYLAAVSLLLMSSSPSISKQVPQADFRDVAFLMIGHHLCKTIPLRRVASVAKRVADRQNVSVKLGSQIISRKYQELLFEIRQNPGELNYICNFIPVMDEQIP